MCLTGSSEAEEHPVTEVERNPLVEAEESSVVEAGEDPVMEKFLAERDPYQAWLVTGERDSRQDLQRAGEKGKQRARGPQDASGQARRDGTVSMVHPFLALQSTNLNQVLPKVIPISACQTHRTPRVQDPGLMAWMIQVAEAGTPIYRGLNKVGWLDLGPSAIIQRCCARSHKPPQRQDPPGARGRVHSRDICPAEKSRRSATLVFIQLVVEHRTLATLRG